MGKAAMTIKKARQICQTFANDHKVVFDEEGECGIMRPCVGFRHGDNWVSFNPIDSEHYNPIPGLQCEAAAAPSDVDAYHKYDCLAVLGRGDEAIIQLAKWVESINAAGSVEIVTYQTGAKGIQAMISGVTGKTLLCGTRQ